MAVICQNINSIFRSSFYFFGKGRICNCIGVGTYSSEYAESLLGESLIFTAEEASYFTDQLSDVGKVASDPVYTETALSESDFVANYRMTLSNLGVDAKEITQVNVTDKKGYVSIFFMKDDNTMILIGGGTYFELVRKDDSVDSVESVQVLAYIEEINTEQKTFMIDEVELLFSTDTERLDELGIKDKDLVP